MILASSLKRGWVCNFLVQLLLDFARAITLGSKSLRTNSHILLSHLRLPKPRGPDPRIHIPSIPTGTGFSFPRLLGLTGIIARVFRRDGPPTRSRRSTGSGGESSRMLTSVEGNAVQGRMLNICSLVRQCNTFTS
jgi:hypothetical protein